MRVGVQLASLGLFVYVALAARFLWPSLLPYDAFLRLDPLVWGLSSIAGRSLPPHGWIAFGLLILTAVFGPLFCGWVCPLGTVIDGLGRVRVRRPGIGLPRPMFNARFWVLLALLGAAAAGANFAGWLDPLAMSGRALHVAGGASRASVGAAICWTLVAVAIGLALLAPRLWCRALCPLGAALSLSARVAPYRKRTTGLCARCGACSSVCPMGNAPTDSSPADCIGCRRCQAACVEQAISFGFGAHSVQTSQSSESGRRTGLSRRTLFASLAVGGAVGLLVRRGSGRRPLRPPGATAEREFVARCIGCGTCLAVCPTGGLLPLVRLERLDGVFSPYLAPRVGGCLPNCTACGDACPTGAIGKITVQDKRTIRIGLAVLDRSRCLPWARKERCLICLDACPREYGAIELRPTGTGVPHPYVRERECTGCGLCEHECPEAAIYVRPEPSEPARHQGKTGRN